MPKSVTRAGVLGIVWRATQATLPRAILLLAALPLGLASPAAQGAEHDFPVVNSVGRFFGVGYTKGGYHASQDGRLNRFTDRQGTSVRRQGGFQPYAQPRHSPLRTVTEEGPTPTLAPLPTDAEVYSQPSAAAERHEIPLPRKSTPQDQPRPQGDAPQRSPSDQLQEESSADQEVQDELSTSIRDTGYPVPVYRYPAPSRAVAPLNRYR